MEYCPTCQAPQAPPDRPSRIPAMRRLFVCGARWSAGGTVSDPATWQWSEIQAGNGCEFINSLRDQIATLGGSS